MSQSHLWLCHWERIDGPSSRGPTPSSMLWICEHPYRTIRQDGPSEDCQGCPVWDGMQRAEALARRKKSPPPVTVERRRSRGGGQAA